MIEAAIWLLRWTLAGVGLSVIVVAAAFAFERAGRAVSLKIFRAALIAALAAPAIALAPPAFTVSAPGTAFSEPDSFVPRFIEPRGAGIAGATAARAQDREDPTSGLAVPDDTLADAFVFLWVAGVAFAAFSRQRSLARLSRAFSRGAAFPASFVECRLSADAPTPLLFGVLRPRMLAPADFHEWPNAERDAVLRHEAAHARRGDLVWALLGDAVRILYWWAPPVRVLVSRHMLATEEACDSASFARNEDRHDYARTLIAVARRVGGHASPALAMTASGLRRRVESLISPRKNRDAAFAYPIIAVGAAAALMLLLAGPATAGLHAFRIYIFDAANGTSSIYALSDGERAAAAIVENCEGRLLADVAEFVDDLESRIHNGGEDELNPVWITGPGSRVEIGPCGAQEPDETDESDDADAADDADDKDSLVMITNVSKKQARDFIRQIDALSASERAEMAAQLGLERR